ncbi:alternative ribosome rescue aminoacyl-tRNA hydrolase ArfB [Rhodoferax sp.]|uniref:alternative ribosome rescue aminoacyl-tRNA hydrolase ArfB n=1 Tax=Rhodoferax sp. TaxID=50421 RepID=UPI00342A3A94
MEPLHVPEDEVSLSAIRAQGAGGQNVNKVSSAIHLRFDIAASSLPDDVKERLLALHDSRITKEGVLVLKAQQHRTQEMNRFDALIRLHELVNSVAQPPKNRKPTRPTQAAVKRVRQAKTQRSEVKATRARVQHEH